MRGNEGLLERWDVERIRYFHLSRAQLYPSCPSSLNFHPISISNSDVIARRLPVVAEGVPRWKNNVGAATV